jgi:Ca-activated chloride channel family protein
MRHSVRARAKSPDPRRSRPTRRSGLNREGRISRGEPLHHFLSTTSTLFLSLFLAASPVMASVLGERVTPDEMRAGGLLFQTEDGYRQAPTLGTDVEIDAAGLIARTKVTQRFTNPTEEWVEGIYVFPLPEGSAVDSLRLRIGDRIIEGRVEERARAKATYQKAKREGRKASLVEQERPNIFTTRIANLGPGETIEVVLTFQEELHYDAGRFSLHFPLVVAPRYIPGTEHVRGFSGTGWATNTNEVPDASRITPLVSLPGQAPNKPAILHPVRMQVTLDMGFPLDVVESPSHSIKLNRDKGNTYTVGFTETSVPANADFVLEWQPLVGDAPSAALFRHSWEEDDYLLMMVMPPRAQETNLPRLSRETIFVIDTSGSMGGESIRQARAAVSIALESLRPEDAFNVIEFNSVHRTLFPASRPASTEAVAQAREWVERLQADGGTEMRSALEAALQVGSESRAVRQVIFVTDGAVGNESALISLIKERLAKSRLYTIGIGSAPNAHFMTKAAQFGRGTFTYIGRPEEVSEKMRELFSKIEQPVLHDLTIDWAGTTVEAWPKRIPDVYLGEPIMIAAKLPRSALAGHKEVLLRGRRGGETTEIRLSLSGGRQHDGVSKLWARRKIAGLMDSLHEGATMDTVSQEVADLGVLHQLVTRWSSLVAVDVTPTRPVDTELDTRGGLSLLPKGWNWRKIFGGVAPRTGQTGPDHKTNGTTPPAVPRAAIGQRMASAQIGRLPQGGTPTTLLFLLGTSLLSTAGAASYIHKRSS